MRSVGFFYETRMIMDSLLKKWYIVGISFVALCAVLFSPMSARAQVFGTVRGIVHNPQHRPIAGATVQLSAAHLDWQRTAQTDANGEFLIDAAPAGEYVLEVTHENFRAIRQSIVVNVGAAPILHFVLELASVESSIRVTAELEAAAPTASSLPTDLTREEIATTPGASYSDSLAMITDFVPSAYIVHDQLHVRGGHQVTWLVDGVPVPNTNIASNVGPQFDPKDVD
jgi:Carboxypeptidase regulatory-like domain